MTKYWAIINKKDGRIIEIDGGLALFDDRETAYMILDYSIFNEVKEVKLCQPLKGTKPMTTYDKSRNILANTGKDLSAYVGQWVLGRTRHGHFKPFVLGVCPKGLAVLIDENYHGSSIKDYVVSCHLDGTGWLSQYGVAWHIYAPAPAKVTLEGWYVPAAVADRFCSGSSNSRLMMEDAIDLTGVEIDGGGDE